MASIQALCLKLVFSLFLVMVLAKVALTVDAAPSEYTNDVELQSIEEAEHGNDVSHLATREPAAETTPAPAAPAPKKKKSELAKEWTAAGVKKSKELYTTASQKVADFHKRRIKPLYSKKGTNPAQPGATPGAPAPAPAPAAAKV